MQPTIVGPDGKKLSVNGWSLYVDEHDQCEQARYFTPFELMKYSFRLSGERHDSISAMKRNGGIDFFQMYIWRCKWSLHDALYIHTVESTTKLNTVEQRQP